MTTLHNTAALRARWAALAPREQALLLLAGCVVGLAVLWWLLLAPALQTWRQSAARHAALDMQLRQMQSLQAQAEQLKNAPRLPQGNAAMQPLRVLQDSANRLLGRSARIASAGTQITVTLNNAPAESLAQWLAQTRSATQTVVQQAKLERAATGTDGSALWNGTLVLGLPSD